PDLIGTGDSDKLLNSGPGSYRFVDHRRYRSTLIWGMLHAIRADYARLLYSVFLLVVGPGRWSVDALLARSKGTTARPVEPMNRQPEPGPMRI
ncbi:MAG: hypothetical protein M3069_33055, partial [Chloroflexota bacterium]|nr:hypothetical protein [Chloroflexota bacterium]